ncbi:hypothetical protein ACRRTK_002248 [Alexandromys fortis]
MTPASWSLTLDLKESTHDKLEAIGGSNENLPVIIERAENVEMTREIHTDKEQFTEGETVENVEAEMRNGEENKKDWDKKRMWTFQQLMTMTDQLV